MPCRVHALPSSPIALAVAAALYPTSFAFAQSTTETEKGRTDELQEIVVTATRRELNLQDVAQSITAFSSADIQKYAIQDLQGVVGALPSLTLVSSQPGRNSIVMRGISTGTEEYRTDSQVSVYLDDQPLTSISQQVDIKPIDIERIESLPGPQGTLFGSSSQAGTLRYITNKPDTEKFSAQMDLEGGKIKGGEENYDASGHINIPVADNFAIRMVGFYSHEGGYIDNVLGTTLYGDRDNSDVVEKNWNGYDSYGGRIAARWQINPDWEMTGSIIGQKSNADGNWESDPALGDYKITRFFDEFRDDKWLQYSLNFKGNLGFAELSVTGSYFDRDIKYEWDNMAYDQWRSTYYASYDLYNTDGTFGRIYNDQRQNRSTYEVRLTSLGDSRFQWMVGGFHEKVDDWWDTGAKNDDLVGTTAWAAAQYAACYAAAAGYDVQCPLPDTNVFYSNVFDKTVKQTAVFGELTYKLTDQWSVTGGARWFEYKRRELDTYTIPLGLPVGGGLATGGQNFRQGKSSDMVYKLGTEFHIDDKRMVYLLFSQGFRLGGNNGTRAASTGLIPLEYDPDKLNNYEVGLKSQWLDNRLQFNVSAFLMKWDDIQLNASSTQPWWVRGTFNGGKAEQKGVEMSGSWNLTRNFSVEASVFLADPQFKENTTFPDGDVLLKGKPMPASPKQKYWLSTEYTIPAFLGLNGDSWIRWSWSWQSKIWKDAESIIDDDRLALTGPWSTSTLQLGFSHASQWDVSLIVRNLFDKRGVNWISGLASDYGTLFGDSRYQRITSIQEPRTVSLSLSKKW